MKTFANISLPIVVVLFVAGWAKAGSGKYTVIGPGTIHSDNEYTVTVAVHRNEQPCEIKVGITGPSYNHSKTVEVPAGDALKNVTFDVPSLDTGAYNLTAEGVNCVENFKNTTSLYYSKFTPNVRIQTDKGLYKPGDTINYRVVFLSKDLRPAKPTKETYIWLEDGKRNRIKEIRDVKVNKGVYTGKFQISEHPTLGSWRLGVHTGDAYDDQVYFDVDKYVLPKFVAQVEATKRVSVKDGDMQVIVRANYTYGKPLTGKVTLVVNLLHYYYRPVNYLSDNAMQNPPPTIIKSADMVQGKAKIDMNVKEYEAYLPHMGSPTTLAILATIEEQFTGVKINATTYVTVYPYRYSMNCITYDTCSLFQPGKETKMEYLLSTVDGTHLNDTKTPVELTFTEVLRPYYTYSHGGIMHVGNESVVTPVSDNLTFHFTTHMNESGIATFNVKLDDLKEYKYHSHYYKMKLKYRDEERDISNTYQYREPEIIVTNTSATTHEPAPADYFDLVYLKNYKSIEMNKPNEFTVNSSRPLPYINYIVVGRGNILESGHVDLPDKPKVYNLSLTPNTMWSPHFAVYVYYVDEKDEYIYDENKFFVTYTPENQLSIEVADKVKPGSEVELKIRTARNSFVALMAVDQSALLLRSNNDFYNEHFEWALDRYTTSTPRQGGYTQYPGENSGVVTLTNAHYFYNYSQPIYWMNGRIGFSGGVFYKTTMQSEAHALGSPMHGASAADGAQFHNPTANIRVRKDFSETWIFDNIENTEQEEFTWSKKIPDTITSWVLTGFSMNDEKGLALTGKRTDIITFQPFFISIRLPYSVKRGEVINVMALVFNYLPKDLDVDVTLSNDDNEYEFIDVSNDVLDDQNQMKKTVHVKANDASGISFMLRPKVIGNIMLKYTATSPVAGDIVHKSLKVVPEGETKYVNKAFLVNLKNTSEVHESVDIDLPEDVVPDSQYVTVGSMGDIMGPVLNNLDNLIRKPTGCGEQTMSTLLPNYLVMKYLKFMKKLTPALENKLLYNLESGYQNMQKFLHPDGSFSVFGLTESNKHYQVNGSTWLTAYVIRSLQEIQEFTTVSQDVIDKGLKYLASMQAANGSFTEKGDRFYGGGMDDITLSSMVVLAFIQNKSAMTNYTDTVRKGVEYLAQNVPKTEKIKSLAIGVYTLLKADHAEADKHLEKLRTLAQTEDDFTHWSTSTQSERALNNFQWWHYIPNNDVEITAYAALAILQPNGDYNIDDMLPIIRWLIAQRNSFGGFGSTQDTIVGLRALIKFAERSDYEAANMSIGIETKGQPVKRETLNLNEDNSILYQQVELPGETNSIDITATGTGIALLQVSYQFNVYDKANQTSFEVRTLKSTRSTQLNIIMDVCVTYTGENEASNMVLLEISLPSGFVIDEDENALNYVRSISSVSHIELQDSSSKLVVYFAHLNKGKEVCVPVQAFRSHAVAQLKPASIVVYDYYDNSRKVTTFYEVDSTLCDICDGEEECSKCS